MYRTEHTRFDSTCLPYVKEIVFYFCHFIIWSSIDNCVGGDNAGFKGGGKKLGVAKTLNI